MNMSVVRSSIIALIALSLITAFTGCSLTTESKGLKVVDVERGDSVNGVEADDNDDDIMLVTIEATNDDAKGKLNELIFADDTDLFKLFKGEELVAEASSISKASNKSGSGKDNALVEATFPVPKDMKSGFFLSVESFPKMSLDNHSSQSDS